MIRTKPGRLWLLPLVSAAVSIAIVNHEAARKQKLDDQLTSIHAELRKIEIRHPGMLAGHHHHDDGDD